VRIVEARGCINDAAGRSGTVSIALSDRIEMPESTEVTLDDLFETIERMPFPEGYKVEIVEGTVYMSPQRDVHWDTILAIVEQLRTKFPRKRVKSDVRYDFPGRLNGFCPDVALLAEDAKRDSKGRHRSEDVVFVAEVISRDTAANDYGTKKAIYAYSGLPALLIVDPYQRQCHLYTEPKKNENDRLKSRYETELTVSYGKLIDLSDTPAGVKLATDDFDFD
jgi:Uma2 family endonuclease